MKRRIIAMVLLVVALVALVGCSGGSSVNGTYKLTKFMGMDIEQANTLYNLSNEGSLEDIFVITLKSGGKAKLDINGEELESEYKIAGESITLSYEDESISGTIKGGVITLSIEDIEFEFTKK